MGVTAWRGMCHWRRRSAPEVVAEQTGGTVSSEVWSLGATVYSLLAGHSPFERRWLQRKTFAVVDVLGQQEIEADADHGHRCVCLSKDIAAQLVVQFDENAAEFGAIVQDVVRPFQLDAGSAAGFEGFDDRQTNREREPGHAF